jgi:hypothetical protein
MGCVWLLHPVTCEALPAAVNDVSECNATRQFASMYYSSYRGRRFRCRQRSDHDQNPGYYRHEVLSSLAFLHSELKTLTVDDLKYMR